MHRRKHSILDSISGSLPIIGRGFCRSACLSASIGVAALLLCTGQGAHADTASDRASDAAAAEQTASTASPTGRGGQGALDEILVTAERRSENVQKVGGSISVISSEDLVTRNVNTVSDLQYLTPSLQVTPQFGSGQPVFQIRGVGLTDYGSNNAPAVGIYLDEVAYPVPFATNGLMYDVQRVEVLRGPQGTLYGRNTTGGAINYIMNKPTNAFEAGLTAQFGNFNSTQVDGFVSGPISDNLRFRIAGENRGGGAWQRNIETGEKLGDVNRHALRGLLDYDPTSSLKLEFNVHWSQDRSDANGLYLFSPLTSLHTAHPPLYPIYPAFTGRYETDWGTTPQFAGEIGTTPTAKPFSRIDTAGASTRADWDIDFATLTDLLSYDHAQRAEYDNFDASSQSAADVYFNTRASVIANELRLTSNPGDALDWVGGLYYSNQLINDRFATGYLPLNGFDRDVRYSQTVNTVSLFGQATYKITPKLRLTGGLRAEYEKRSLNDFSAFYIVDNEPTNPNNTLAHRSTSFTQPSGKVELQYQVSDDDMAYALVSRGIKSGGFTAYNSNSVQISTTPFKPEKLLAYEVGNKFSIPEYGIRLNLSAFYYDYRDEQIQAAAVNPLTGLVGALVNAPKSHLAGGEAEVDWQPVHSLTFTQSVGYAQGEFDEFNAITSAQRINGVYVGVATNRKGVTLPAPRLTADGSAAYMAALGQLNLTTTGSYSSRTQYNSLFGAPYNVKGYTLANVNMTLAPQNGRWNVALFGENIFNRRYDVTRNFFVGGDNIALAGMPATWGVRFGMKY